MSEPFVNRRVSGWGRYPAGECRIFRPEKWAGLAKVLREGGQRDYIARGMGRSYGDAAINAGGGVILCERLNRMLEFDAAAGVLHCEAGVTFAEIIDVFLPRGFFIPVTPGTKFITVGGAIANDVHGKNHHRDGSFGNALIDFELLLPSGELRRCSREENAELFWATLGGVGLTGIVRTARVRLRPVESAYIVVDYYKSRDLDGVLAAIAESDDKYQYSMAWVDALARGGKLGRSVLMRGNHATPSDLPLGRGLFDARPKRRPGVPFDFPSFVLNPLSIRAFNTLVYALSSGAEGKIVDYDSYFFPLDAIHDWNRMYGKRGFVQYQATVPLSERRALVKLLEASARSGRASFLAVLKKFGPGNDGWLSHPFEGYTLTLDFAVNDTLPEFLRGLDKMLLDHGGRLYLAKDAVMTADTFAAMYPRAQAFRELRQRIDPEGRLSSGLARRVGLVEGRGR